MKETPNYYAIIPANVRYDNKLKANEKLLYAEITSLVNKTGECWASNSYFAGLYNVTKQAISRWLLSLQKNKYITIQYYYKNNSKEIEKRLIKLEVSTNIDTCQQIVQRCQQKVKENNKRIIINNNNSNMSSNYNSSIFKVIINYLNTRTKSNFKDTTSSTRKHISARLHEGFTIEDFKKVIDVKTMEWINDNKMKVYLRPETLFGTKFESYLNQYQAPIQSNKGLSDITMESLNDKGQ